MAAEAQALDVQAMERRLRAVESELAQMRTELLGSKTNVGLIALMRAEIKDCYQTLGNMEKLLMKMQRAMR